MRRMLCAVAAGLLVLSGSAWADGLTGQWHEDHGPIVRWDRIEGVTVHPDDSPFWIGELRSVTHVYTVGRGRAMVNLKTGFLSFYVEGLALGDPYTGFEQPLGAVRAERPMVGTIVCDAHQNPVEPPTWIDTPSITLKYGTGGYQGVVTLPQACLDRPLDIGFLLRTVGGVNPSQFVAYGAGRTLQ